MLVVLAAVGFGHKDRLSNIDYCLMCLITATGGDSDGNPLGFKKLFQLNGVQLGVLPACYAAGMTIAGFIFSHLSVFFNSFQLIGVGMLLWTIGVVLTGITTSYGMLIAARIMAGCGKFVAPQALSGKDYSFRASFWTHLPKSAGQAARRSWLWHFWL